MNATQRYNEFCDAHPEFEERREEFLDSFAIAAEVPRDRADETWAGYSYQLSDGEIRAAELLGSDEGFRMGAEFLATRDV